MLGWDRRSAICDSFPLFLKTFSHIFQAMSPGREAAKALVSLRQGQRSMLDYAVKFQMLVEENGWNQLALVDAFYNGLWEVVKDQLTSVDLPAKLDAYITLASKINRRLWSVREVGPVSCQDQHHSDHKVFQARFKRSLHQFLQLSSRKPYRLVALDYPWRTGSITLMKVVEFAVLSLDNVWPTALLGEGLCICKFKFW